MISAISIKDALKSSGPVDSILVRGWVRTRRDSKTFSFIELNDGSSLRSLQIIANDTLPNYAEIQRLTTGAALAVHGKLIASQGKGQSWEVVADQIDIVGASDESYPLAEKGTHTGIFARDRASAAALELVRLGFSRAQPARLRHPSIFPGARLLLSQHAHHYRQRLRRRRRIVSRHGDRSEESAEDSGRKYRLRERFFRAPNLSHRQRATRSRSVRLRALEGLHLRSDVPRGELQHFPPRERILDDRAGDGVLRFAGQHGCRRRDREISDSRHSRELSRTNSNCSPSLSTRN